MDEKERKIEELEKEIMQIIETQMKENQELQDKNVSLEIQIRKNERAENEIRDFYKD